MATPKKGRRTLVVDDQTYCVYVSRGRSKRVEGVYPISFTAHREGSDNAILSVQGLSTRDFWWDYPDIGETIEEHDRRYLKITPKAMVALIRHFLAKGWDPDRVGQTRYEIGNELLTALTADNGAGRCQK